MIHQYLTDESFIYDNLLIAPMAAWFSNDYNIVCFMLTSLDERPCFSRLITQITFFLYIVILTFIIVEIIIAVVVYFYLKYTYEVVYL